MNETVIAVDLAENIFELAVSTEPRLVSKQRQLSRQPGCAERRLD